MKVAVTWFVDWEGIRTVNGIFFVSFCGGGGVFKFDDMGKLLFVP